MAPSGWNCLLPSSMDRWRRFLLSLCWSLRFHVCSSLTMFLSDLVGLLMPLTISLIASSVMPNVRPVYLSLKIKRLMWNLHLSSSERTSERTANEKKIISQLWKLVVWFQWSGFHFKINFLLSSRLSFWGKGQKLTTMMVLTCLN